METVCELLLSAEDLLLICKSVSESDVLKPVLMYFLIFCLVVLFPVLDHLGTQLLSSPAENSILSDTSLQLLELMFNFLAFLLLLVELVLQFRGHPIVTILCLFQVESDLMDISECVEILVLMKELV